MRHEAEVLKLAMMFRADSQGVPPPLIISAAITTLMTAIAEAPPATRKGLVGLMDETLADSRSHLEKNYL